MNQIALIALGFTILFTLNFSITGIFIFIYVFMTKKKMGRKELVLLITFLSIVNCVLQVLSLIFLTTIASPIVFFLSIFALSVAGYTAIMYYRYKFGIWETLVLSGVLSLCVNPIWFRLFRII